MGNAEQSVLSPQWAGSPVVKLTSDDAILTRFLAVETAWLTGLSRQGIPAGATRAALEQLTITNQLVAATAENSWMAGNPAVGFVQHLRDQLPPEAQDENVFHVGLTSQDVIDSAMMMTAHMVLDQLQVDLRVSANRLAEMARRFGDTVCVTRTLTQHAEASLLGFRFATWLSGIIDALDTVEEVDTTLPVQIGGAVGNRAAMSQLGSQVDVDQLVRDVAEVLGLAVPRFTWHSNRQPVLAVAQALASSSAALGVIAHNLVALGRPEVAELAEDVAPGHGASSAMPHKKNPTRSILAHSVSQRVPNLMAQIQASATPVAERGEGSWNAEWEPLRDLMRLVVGQAHHVAAVLDGLRVDEDVVARNLAQAGLPSTEVSAEARAYMTAEIHRMVELADTRVEEKQL